MKTAKPELLLPNEFVHEAINKIDHAKVRVRLLTTIMTEDASTRKLIRSLAAASKRGVDIEVGADVFTFGVINEDWNPIKSFNRGLKSARQMRKHLLAAGVTFQWIGRLGPVMFAGRTHIKWLIVDDYVYTFGGVNLYKPGISHTDFMLGLPDAQLADRLEDEHRRIVHADKIDKFYKSHTFECTYGKVLIDGGVFNNSVIYKRACQLALEAEKVLLVSQYCPSGKLGEILKHTSTRFYFNHWKNASGFNQFLIRWSMFFSKIQTDYEHNEYIHAKFMIFEMPDGQKVAITGSHNFVHGGVLLGTREIALETTNQKIIADLERFWKEKIA